MLGPRGWLLGSIVRRLPLLLPFVLLWFVLTTRAQQVIYWHGLDTGTTATVAVDFFELIRLLIPDLIITRALMLFAVSLLFDGFHTTNTYSAFYALLDNSSMIWFHEARAMD